MSAYSWVKIIMQARYSIHVYCSSERYHAPARSNFNIPGLPAPRRRRAPRSGLTVCSSSRVWCHVLAVARRMSCTLPPPYRKSCFCFGQSLIWLINSFIYSSNCFISSTNVNSIVSATLLPLPESCSLSIAIYWALRKTHFVKCHTWHNKALDEEWFCREPSTWHKMALDKEPFAESPALGKNMLSAKRR